MRQNDELPMIHILTFIGGLLPLLGELGWETSDLNIESTKT